MTAAQDPGHTHGEGAPPPPSKDRARAAAALVSLERDAWIQAERHITAAGFWGNVHWVIGAMAAVFAAVASGTAFTDSPMIAGVLALVAAGSAALATALRPADISAQHLKAATAYHSLQIDARDMREFDMPQSDSECDRLVITLDHRWAKITGASPRVSKRLFRVSAKHRDAVDMRYYPSPALPQGGFEGSQDSTSRSG